MSEAMAEFKIGIIGCGVIGKSILNALIFLLGWIEPSNIHVSTRRPENLSKYEDIGLNIYFDNDKLIEHCDIIILCIPPSLDNWGIVELRDALQLRMAATNKLQPLIISVVSNLYIHKLQKLLFAYRVYARTHINKQEELENEKQYGKQLFGEKELLQQLMITFQFIFQDDKIKEDEFKLENIDRSIQEALLGQQFQSLDDPNLIEIASNSYSLRLNIYKRVMQTILKKL